MEMDYEVVRKPKQYIVGLVVRTDNEKAMKDIPSICEKFQDGWQEKGRERRQLLDWRG